MASELTDDLIIERLQFGFTLWHSARSGSYYLQHGLPGCGGRTVLLRNSRVKAMLHAGLLETSTDPTTKALILIPAGSGTYTVP